MEEIRNYYFSFGQSHVHRVDGVTLDADVLLKVRGTYGDARQRVFDAIGDKWAMQYDEENLEAKLKYFPRGVVEVASI